MNPTSLSVVKGVGVALILAVPLWWLPVVLQREIPDLWLAVIMAPPAMLGGYAAARRALRPMLSGALAGFVAMSLIAAVSVTGDKLWMVPILGLAGGVPAALGATLAMWRRRAGTQK